MDTLEDGEGEELVEEMIQPEQADEVDASIVQEETYNIETSKETAETDRLRTSEQEEKKTFVITGGYRMKKVQLYQRKNSAVSVHYV